MPGPNQKGASSAPEIDLDSAGKDSFHSWYRSLPQDEKTVRFFDRRTCMSVHGEHASMVSKFLYKSTAQVTCMGQKDSGLPGITLSYNLFPIILNELLVASADHAVELYENGSASGNNWKLVKKGSPGMWRDFEADLERAGDVAETPIVVSITLGYHEGARIVGLAYLDLSGYKMGACEFVDDEHFCILETALTQLGPKEGVIPLDLSLDEGSDTTGQVSQVDRTRLADVISQCGVLIAKKPKSTFSAKNLSQDLSRLLKGGREDMEANRPILDLKFAPSAIAGLLQFVDLMPDTTYHSRMHLEMYNVGKYMRIDTAAQKALNIMRSKVDSAESFSLHGLLSRCRTAMGKRLLKVWLKQPLTEISSINARLDVVESLIDDASLRSDLNGLHLRGMPDIERLTRKLERQTATLQDLCQLYRVSSRIPHIETVLRGHQGDHAESMVKRYAEPLALAHDTEHLSKFEDLLEAAVDLDRIPDEYLISASYDDDLKDIQGQKMAIEQEIEQAAEATAEDLGLILDKSVKLEWHKVSNQKIRCLRITAKEEKSVRKKLQAKYIELETRKDGVKFTSRRLRNAAQQLQQLSSEYDAKQALLVKQVVAVAATFSEVWEKVSSILGDLDVLCGFAEVAASAPTPYTRPEILPQDGDRIILKGSRHPCVEAQDSVDFIPNDVSMSKGNSWFQIITGPNMGGKSTYIRQVGMCVLMAQIGCFVPCDSATISIRDAIFARVGAGDCQMRGISTFMAEMLETASILKGATSSSLVIIDELGRGTSTWDGMGLAWAISEYLMEKIGAASLFATHFHELTALQGSVGVKNLHVKSSIDPKAGGLTMLYQVHEGSCDQSLGIHVAEFARFPKEVLELARQKAQEIDLQAVPNSSLTDPINSNKKRGGEQIESSIKKALLEFASVSFESMSDEQLVAEASRWAEELGAIAPSETKRKAMVA